MIRNVKMSWVTEKHSFEFQTNGNKVAALDFLGDFIGSLEALREAVLEYDYNNLPETFTIKGDQCTTDISPRVQAK